MKDMFLTVLNMSLSASVVILAVLVARLLLRQAPKKWSYLLWSVVAFRLACPVSLESVFSIFRAAPVKPAVSQVSTVGQAPASAIQYIPQTMTTAPMTNVGAVPTVPAVSPAVTAPTASGTVTAQVWLVAAIAAWVVGMATLLLYAVVSYLELRQSLSTATRLEGNIYEADGIRSPFILGLFRPKIYIPYGLDSATLGYVLDHERCHIRRGDHIWKTLAYILLTVHWFNPLVWLAFHLMGRDMEMSCDEKVLGRGENIRRAYSTTLLSFATERRFPAAAPLAFGETAVKTRIKNALNWKKPKTWMTLLAAVLCIALVVSCAVNPTAGPENLEQQVKAVGQYKSMEDYVNQRMADVKTVTYYSISGLLSSYSEAERELTANVTATKLAWLEKKGELGGLAPEGTLECWEYNYLVQIDADPDDVSMLSEEDGWFDLEGQGGHIVVALRYPDGTYDILGDQPKNDGYDFYGFHESVEESLYDWYVEDKGLDMPLYVIETAVQRPEALGGFQPHPFHRYDGDGWYVYIPVQDWELEGVDDGGGAQWRSLYGSAYFTVEPFQVGTWDPDDRNPADFPQGYEEVIAYNADRTMGYRVFITYAPAEFAYDESNFLWMVPRELELMLNSFTVDERFAKAKTTADPEPMETAPDRGLTIPIPQEYRELLDIEYTADSVSLYEKRSREEFRADYPNGFDGQSADSAGMGWLCTISRVDEAGARDALIAVDIGGTSFIGTDAQGNYYVYFSPTDVRCYRAGGVPSVDNMSQWEELTQWSRTLPDAFLAQHSELTAVTDEEARQALYVPSPYEGLEGMDLLNAVLSSLADRNGPKGIPTSLSYSTPTDSTRFYDGATAWNDYAYGIVNNFTYSLFYGKGPEGGNTVVLAADREGWVLWFCEDTPNLLFLDCDYSEHGTWVYRAEAMIEDVFSPNPYTLARSWFDECEFLAASAAVENTVIPTDEAEDFLEAARKYNQIYEGVHLTVSPGSKYKYTYVESVVTYEKEYTEYQREQGRLFENEWGVSVGTIFVPETDRVMYYAMAGNTAEIQGDPDLEAHYPDAPEGAYIYWRVGHVKLIGDGNWAVGIGGTGW